MQDVDLYSDGSSRGNPGPGGYGTVLRFVDSAGRLHEKELSCGFEQTTNNRMELLGAIAGLESLKRPHEVRFVWVKGHAGHPENERCDQLATAAADGQGRLRDDGFEQGL